MKKLLLISAIILAVTAGYSFARMGGGMMGGQQGQMGQGGMMGGQQGQMGQGGMTSGQQGQMGQGGMMQMMSQMGDIMQRASALMTGDMKLEDMKEISEITREMSKQMMDMSNMLRKGGASQKDMQILKQRMMETGKRLNKMR